MHSIVKRFFQNMTTSFIETDSYLTDIEPLKFNVETFLRHRAILLLFTHNNFIRKLMLKCVYLLLL